ncbi:unnamed protein product [Urochloa humidicola]
MASADGNVHRTAVPVVACIVLLLLSMASSPVMADVEDDCGTICRPGCDGFTSEICRSISEILPLLSNLDFFKTTCKVRVSTLCRTLCYGICTLNTLTPGAPMPAPGSTAALPPCQPY